MTMLDLIVVVLLVAFGAMLGIPVGIALGAALWKKPSNSYGKPPVANYTFPASKDTQ